MAKQSGYILRQQAKKQAEIHAARMFTVQQCKDIMLIAAHLEFGFGEERSKRLGDAFDRAFIEYAEMAISDEKEIWYTKAKMDGILKEACGKYFDPWEVRYNSGKRGF